MGGEVYFGTEIVTDYNSRLGGRTGSHNYEWTADYESKPTINAFLTRRVQLLLYPLRILKFENLK